MRISYHPDYTIPLPEGHTFPMEKYRALYRILKTQGLLEDADVVEPSEADWADLALVHTPEYLTMLREGTMDRATSRKLGFPWSDAVLRRARLAVQGTINAAMMALQDGHAANLAGGTHHAFPDRGEGFCLLHDVAIAIRVYQRRRWIRTALTVDLDVHQGNGTAAIFAGDPSVYTFSMHGAKNYPFRKERSSLDVELTDGCGDAEYLGLLAEHLPRAIAESGADLAFYLAGVDPVLGDRLGRLALSEEGLYKRDRMVFAALKEAGIPMVLVMSGGYSASAERTAELHAVAHRAARDVFGPPPTERWVDVPGPMGSEAGTLR
ncbi:Acetoin utilization protein AcuC [compost metagenome]